MTELGGVLGRLVDATLTQFPWLAPVLLGGVTLMLRLWVPGWAYDAMVEERDFYRDLAHNGTSIGRQAVDLLPRIQRSRPPTGRRKTP